MSTHPYGESYYRSHLATGDTEIEYERNDHWLTFFGRMADDICARLAPTTVFDAGCAMGFLVEALRERGVDASGMDVSEYAVSHAHPKIADHVRVGSLLDGIPGHYDLVTCIEVIEHLPAAHAPSAVRVLTAASDQILLSTTPDDFAEPTHENVQPPEYWAELFADEGFLRDTRFDASFVTPWAMLMRRASPTLPGLVREREAERWQLVRERDELRSTLLDQSLNRGENDKAGRTEAESTVAELRSTVERLRDDLRIAIDAAHGADAERATVAGRLRHVEYALDLALARETEVAELIEELDRLAGGDAQRLAALANSRSFRVYRGLLAPYHRLRGSS